MSENSAVEWGGDDKKQVLFYRPFYFIFLPSTLRYPMREGSDYRRRSGRELEE